MARALRNIYTHHIFSTPVYINKLKGAPRPASIGHAPHTRSLSRLLRAYAERSDQDNLIPCSRETCSNSWS